MGWQTVMGGMAICVMLALALPVAAADSACGDTAACGTSLDDGNAGDNQGGDAGAEREPPDDNKKG